MILITGAAGKTGRALIKTLSKTESVCALVHRDAQVSAVKSLGARRVIIGDLRDESEIRAAVQGARSVYHICPNMLRDEAGIGALVIEQAQEAGVEHFVYHSVLHPQAEKMSHHWQKLRVEEMLLESGLRFTILQPAPYMQNLLAAWEGIVEDGFLRVPYSVSQPFSFVDLEDLVEAATIVLTGANHAGATYELVGTAPLSHVEVAGIFSRVLHREVRAEREEISQWRSRAQRSVGRDAYAMNCLVKMFEYYDKYGLAGNTNVLRWILRRAPTTVEEFIERIAMEQHAGKLVH